jgi:hypothetical protein
VCDYINQAGFGGIDVNQFYNTIPPAYWPEAHDFADYLNQGSNAADLCLENIQASVSNNPYKAPKGTIVVVRAGTPGTSHPTAGDIAISSGGGQFWNGGEMGYGGSSNFPPSNDYVLGIYAPTSCCGSCSGGGGCGEACANCIENGGGKACADGACQGCSKECTDCIKGGGGKACEDRCVTLAMEV